MDKPLSNCYHGPCRADFLRWGRDARYCKPNRVACAHFPDWFSSTLRISSSEPEENTRLRHYQKDEIVTLNKPEMAASITILVDGKPAKELRSTEILLQNVGTKDIQEQDVGIWFEPPAEIINFQVAYDPPGFPPEFNLIPKTRIGMKVSLLNPGDQITIHCLTANDSAGMCKVIAKGPNFTLKRFHPELFVSPLVNGTVAVLWIMILVWTCAWSLLRVIENPTGQAFWEQIISLTLMVSLSAVLTRLLYESTIRAYKRLSQRFRNDAE